MRICDDIAGAVGGTPMVRLQRLVGAPGTRLYGKCEFMNPGGSIKDRIGFHMVAKAEASGQLRLGGTIVEATAGNTGMGLAMAAALRGYRLIAVMTTKMSKEKVDLLRTLGAEIVMCPYEVPFGSPEHFMSRARAIAASTPDAWYADQFANGDNAEAHLLSTGPEIWQQTEGQVQTVVAGMGTGGSLTGIGRYLRSMRPDIELVLADPVGSVLKQSLDGCPTLPRPYRIEGIGGDFVPRNADLSLVTQAVSVGDAEAIDMAMRMFRSEGMFVGGSSGVILAAALRYLSSPQNAHKYVVALLPDSGRAYLSTIYSPEWRAAHQLNLAND
jgi:cystathionine beta-synthase